ncbi:hypothetical protein DQG23_12580 [Paenibacillus contaminans]|uniref:Uncharacterized protein n=1 Tax=Paenibacillus contaminans TaxID=450362 RepID=A0A329MLW1_9BACL|nr:hypothetical protein DQG23_12580 [Paenibacillus contaminans]
MRRFSEFTEKRMLRSVIYDLRSIRFYWRLSLNKLTAAVPSTAHAEAICLAEKVTARCGIAVIKWKSHHDISVAK